MSEKRRLFINGLIVEQGDMQDIQVKKNTKEDYENWKKARNKRIIESDKWENARKRMEGEER